MCTIHCIDRDKRWRYLRSFNLCRIRVSPVHDVLRDGMGREEKNHLVVKSVTVSIGGEELSSESIEAIRLTFPRFSSGKVASSFLIFSANVCENIKTGGIRLVKCYRTMI